MRTTFTMVNRNVQQNLSRRYSDMVQLQEQLATGKRLRKPSDDPIDVANTIKLRTKETQLQQYKRNLEDGMAVMGVASTAMQSMNELLHRMRELAVQGANDTNTTSDRQYIQQEVDQLFRQMMSVINTQFKGDYIFNGTQTKIPPYEIKASDNELMDYINKTMATYGGTNSVPGETSIIREAATERPGESIYLDFEPMLKVGDKIQMKWDGDGANASLILPETLPLDSFTIDLDGDGIIDPDTETFYKDIGNKDTQPSPDYTVDHRTGEITILSEKFRDALTYSLPAVSEVDDGLGNITPLYSVIVSAPLGVGNSLDPDDPAYQANATDAIKYANSATVQIINIKDQGLNLTPPKLFPSITDILPGSLKISIGDKEYIEGFGEYKPGWYDEEGVYHKDDTTNIYDYSVNYITGEITIYNMDLMRDMRPDDRGGPSGDDNYYSANKFSLTFEHITKGVNAHGDMVASHGQIYRAIEEGISAQINISADEILRDKWTGLDMVGVLMRYSSSLHTGDRDGIQASIDELQAMYDAVLNSQSQIGARIYRFELTHTRNAEQNIDVSTQRSSLEDADLAEIISKLTLSEYVYNAALQAAMRVLQPTLANYM